MFGFQSKPVFIIDTGNFTNISALSMFSVCDNEFVQTVCNQIETPGRFML